MTNRYVRENEDLSDVKQLYDYVHVTTSTNRCEAQFLSTMQLIACIPPHTPIGPEIWENIQNNLQSLLLTATGRTLNKEEEDQKESYDSRCFEGLAKIRELTKDVFSGKDGVVSSQQDTSVEKEQLDTARKVIEKLNKKVDDMRESLEKKEKEVVIPPETLNKLKDTEEKLKQAQEEIERLKKSGGGGT